MLNNLDNLIVSDSRPYLDNQNKTHLGSSEGEIYPIDILRFLKGAWMKIAVAGILGLLAAVFYLLVTPKRYEAVAQIAMAQIILANNSNNSIIQPGINIEEPALLISRLTLPTSFTPQVINVCKVDGGANSGATLAGSIKLSLPKGVANVVELKVLGTSPEEVSTCAQAIFELIKTSQGQIVAPLIAEAKVRLDNSEERLKEAKNLVVKADRSGLVAGATYLSTRDEIRFLLDEIASLNNVIISSHNRAARLIAPIYVNNTPIIPKRRLVLAVGLLGGLLVGLLLTLAHLMWQRLKSITEEQERGVL